MGIPDLRNSFTVLASGKGGGESKTRRTYLHKLAGEDYHRRAHESYSNIHMERGKPWRMRRVIWRHHRRRARRVGFIRNGRKGASPDSLIGADGMVEIETKLPHLMVEVILRGEFPPEHAAQCQRQLWSPNAIGSISPSLARLPSVRSGNARRNLHPPALRCRECLQRRLDDRTASAALKTRKLRDGARKTISPATRPTPRRPVLEDGAGAREHDGLSITTRSSSRLAELAFYAELGRRVIDACSARRGTEIPPLDVR